MIPRITRGVARNYDTLFLIDFDRITNASGHTIYTFDKNTVYDNSGNPVWSIGRDTINDIDTGKVVFSFKGSDVIDCSGIKRFALETADFPRLCSILGRVFLCLKDGSLKYILTDKYVMDSEGKPIYTINGTRYTSRDDPSQWYEVDANDVRDQNWNIKFVINGSSLYDSDGNFLYSITY